MKLAFLAVLFCIAISPLAAIAQEDKPVLKEAPIVLQNIPGLEGQRSISLLRDPVTGQLAYSGPLEDLEIIKRHIANLEAETKSAEKLKALNKGRPVKDVVSKYYPQASYLTYGKKLHFEDSTQLYSDTPLAAVRGPKKEGGVWCDIVLENGSSQPLAEVTTVGKHFTEHTIYQDLVDTGHYLHVTVRVTKGDGNAEFIADLKTLIHSYSHDLVTNKKPQN